MKKNLIIGVIRGYGWIDIEPFFVSLIKNAVNVDCIIFYDDISDWTMNQFTKINNDKINIKLIAIPDEYKNRLIIDLRWTLYINYLQSHKDEYKQVLLTDIRDVIFQDDLFKNYVKYDKYLGYSTEEPKLTEPTNASWIINFFGKETYEKLKSNNIICCGTIWGTIDTVLMFAHEMEKLLKKSKFWGAEQAIANYIIYNKILPIDNLIENDVNNCSVLTNGWRPTEIKNNKILNFNNEIPAVVHQYDRHKHLFELIDKLYRLDNIELSDNYYDLKSNLDMVQSTVYAGHFSYSLKLLLRIIDNYNDDNEWKGTFDRLLRILTKLASMNNESLNLQLLEQAVSHAITLNLKIKHIDFNQLKSLCTQIFIINKKQRTIYKPLKILTATLIWNAAKQFEAKNDLKTVIALIDWIKQIDYNLNAEHYLMLAKSNRLLGNKDEAITNYKKALQLVE